jgi:hypothetical protein
MKLGLFAEVNTLLPGEDPEEFHRLAENLRAELNHVGPLECEQVDYLIALVHRRRRVASLRRHSWATGAT